MFSFLFGSSSAANKNDEQSAAGTITAGSVSKKRVREEVEEEEEEEDVPSNKRVALNAATSTQAEEQEEEDRDFSDRGDYDDLYMSVVKKSEQESIFKMKVPELRTARAKFSVLFSNHLTSLVSLIKRHVPSEHQKEVKMAEDKLALFRETASSSIPTFYFKYVSVPFSKELLANEFEQIITEPIFLSRVDPILRRKTDSEEEYLELREKVRGVFGVLLKHIQSIRSSSSENAENEKDWQELCNKLLKLFVISVNIQFIDEVIEDK